MKCELVGILNLIAERPMPGFSRAVEISGSASTDEYEILRPEPFILPCSNHFKEHILKTHYKDGVRVNFPKLKITIETIE